MELVLQNSVYLKEIKKETESRTGKIWSTLPTNIGVSTCDITFKSSFF